MLSRHFLRAKALQALYAGVTSETSDVKEVLKTFEHNVTRLNELGIMQLSTLGQLTFTDERMMEAAMQKFMPEEKDKNPSRRFAENEFIGRLGLSFEFKKEQERLHIDWADNFDVFRKIVVAMKKTDYYKEYEAKRETTFEDDRAIALVAFKCLMNDETLRDIFYDKELMWEDDFDQIAQYVFMLMKEIDKQAMDESLPCPQVFDPRKEKDKIDYQFAHKLLTDTFNHIDDTEPLIRKHLQNWEMDRVALMDILLINMAVTEFTCCPSIPERVTVDEYIELSKEFSTEKSRLFINGILDKILIELRVAGKINKDERGLYDPEIDN